MKINIKIMKQKTAKRFQMLRNFYAYKINQHIAKMLVFMNENAANEHICYKKQKWTFNELSFHIVQSVK